jgi:hypothetical protein
VKGATTEVRNKKFKITNKKFLFSCLRKIKKLILITEKLKVDITNPDWVSDRQNDAVPSGSSIRLMRLLVAPPAN